MTSSHTTPDAGRHGHEIHFTVDGDKLKTERVQLTPVKILELAGIDPASHYLVRVRGHEQISYEEHPHKHIDMCDGMTFISVSKGPTPVS